jgi:hypothetical protein
VTVETTHIIKTQEVTYKGDCYNSVRTLIVCSCGAEVGDFSHVLSGLERKIEAAVLNHKVDVLAAKAGIEFKRGTLPNHIEEE